MFIDHVLISDFSQVGIRVVRAGAGKLFVKDTVVRNNAGTGIAIAPSTGVVEAVIDNVHSNLNAFGVAVASGNKAMVNRSVLSGNSSAGIQIDAGGKLTADNSVISSNVTGISAGAGSTVMISNLDIAFNGTGISRATTSFGNNRISGNMAPGTAPTAVGVDSHDKGQQ